jgi:quinol monooxygenase YgiN
MIIRKVDLEINKENLKAFENIFTERNPSLNNVEGCHRVELVKHPDVEYGYSTISLWDSEEALSDYRNSDYFNQTWKMLKPLFASKAKAITYNLVAKS